MFHAFVFFAFTFYTLVNIFDLAEGFLGFSTLYRGGLKPFRFNDNVLLNPHVPSGIPRDSLIVGVFILLHVGSRWLGQAIRIAKEGHPDWFQPTATVVSSLFAGLPQSALTVGEHVTWWMALGLILLFLPYFPYSKHIHLMIAPINWILRDPNRPLGVLDPPTNDGAGTAHLHELRWWHAQPASFARNGHLQGSGVGVYHVRGLCGHLSHGQSSYV